MGSSSEEGCDIRCGGFDFDDNRFFQTLNSMSHTFGMTANVARAENVNLFSHCHLDLSLNDICQGFVRMDMERRADSGLVMNLQKGHFVTHNQWLYQEVAIHRLAF